MCTPEIKPMQRDTIFDLASLTKPIVIATLMMRFVEEGTVELNAPIQNYLPEFIHPQVTDLSSVDPHLMDSQRGVQPT